MSQAEATRRVNEVVLVIRNSQDELIGVTTVYTRDFARPGNVYYYFRMFIRPTERKSYTLLKVAYRKTFIFLDNFQQVEMKPYGLIMVMENQKLSGKRFEKWLADKGLVYWGKNELGQAVWYRRFDAGLPES